jgi:hypothetical protein
MRALVRWRSWPLWPMSSVHMALPTCNSRSARSRRVGLAVPRYDALSILPSPMVSYPTAFLYSNAVPRARLGAPDSARLTRRRVAFGPARSSRRLCARPGAISRQARVHPTVVYAVLTHRHSRRRICEAMNVGSQGRSCHRLTERRLSPHLRHIAHNRSNPSVSADGLRMTVINCPPRGDIR